MRSIHLVNVHPPQGRRLSNKFGNRAGQEEVNGVFGKICGAQFLKKNQPWLVWLGGLSAGLRTKGLRFDPQSGHMPGLQARHERQPHIDLSVPLFIAPFPCLKSLKMNQWELHTLKESSHLTIRIGHKGQGWGWNAETGFQLYACISKCVYGVCVLGLTDQNIS